jgi:squalene synthase HpnC
MNKLDTTIEAARPQKTTFARTGPEILSGPETPSGKGAGDENFPVGSFLLPKHLRPHVAKFYAFARAADDIADNDALTPDDKIERLNAFQAALMGAQGYGSGYEKALALRESLIETNVTDKHACDLLAAFRQDAIKLRYANWQELLDYCELSANPVGRYLLDLHGEASNGYPYSDALCTVLQILNHMQDCGDDQRELHRVYIPGDWMELEEVSSADLSLRELEPGMRRVFDRMLREVETLMERADDLPRVLSSKSLAMESAVIVRLAHRLSARLRKGDPLATRVKLSKLDFLMCGTSGIFQGYFGSKRKP